MKNLVGISAAAFVSAISLALVFHVQPAFAATISPTVTTATGGPTDCTLDDALQAAETNAAVNGCAAGSAYPTVDVISIGAGTYHFQNSIAATEAVTISGAGKTSTRIVLDSTMSPSNLFDMTVSHPSNQTHAFTLQNMTVEMPDFMTSSILFSGTTHATLTLNHVDFTATTDVLSQGPLQLNAENTAVVTVLYDDVTSGSVSYSQSNSANLSSTFRNSKFIGDSASSAIAMVAMYADSTNPGNTTLINSEVDGNGTVNYGVLHNNPSANDRFNITNSAINSSVVGVQNVECALDSNLSVGSMYITNSMIGGTGMILGLLAGCGHTYVKDSTFNQIAGSAVLVQTNPVDGALNRYHSKFESYNNTFANITPDGSFYNDTAYVMPSANLNGVIVFNTDNTGSAATGSEAYLTHNTFANNTLGSYSTIDFANAANFANFTLRNNAIAGSPISGTYSASTKTVSHNLTTASASSGIAHVDSLVLGSLADNGGAAAIGINGALGNVLTMMPLAASPLIDGAPYAGLNSDERGVARSIMAAYDIGAVEIAVNEFTALGGVWPLPEAPNTGVGMGVRIDTTLEPLIVTTLLLVVVRYIWRVKRH